ncbi:BTAD domain-containing putative transcriptional regulator [Streptomyces sp. NPDC058657]|uniref:AfsR/SARP family transcriptional regulator n=1 Tax=unclassified Streptomyces TaxID=2593676 RepID=UPI0036477282
MEFQVLGTLEACEDGVPVLLRGMRRQRLLALLLLHANRVVPLRVLVEELWEDPPHSARQQVHNAVRDLRQALAGARDVTLVTADVGYRLQVPAGAVDAHRFTDQVRAAGAADREGRTGEAVRLLQDAVDLWRGEAWTGIDCPSVVAAAIRLGEQRLAALETLMELRLRMGESATLVGYLSELVAGHPLREHLRGSLMTALHRSGRQADALRVYEEGRRFLTEELGLVPGPRLRRLHAEVLADDSFHGDAASGPDGPDAVRESTAGESEPTGPDGPEAVRESTASESEPTGPAEPDAPSGPGENTASDPAPSGGGNCLPHSIADFTGRAGELARLDGMTATGRSGEDPPVMVAIDGMGGVGKTTLAVRFAHRVATRYPDGQFYVDLHGYSPTQAPLPAREALGMLLRASGLEPARIPDALAERSALWRARLAGMRCLVVMDDAADSDHVAPMLPGAGDTLVLVTSRRRLTALDGALPLHLDVLPRDDAETLFRRIAGERRTAPEPARTAQAVELCGRLPLAVRIAATRLRDRPAWTLADLIGRLSGAGARIRFLRTADRDLMAVLRVSYERLPAAQRRLGRQLGLHLAPTCDVAQAAALTGLPDEEVERCFETLVEDNLAQEVAPARYALHRLLRDCALTLPLPAAG